MRIMNTHSERIKFQLCKYQQVKTFVT